MEVVPSLDVFGTCVSKYLCTVIVDYVKNFIEQEYDEW